MFPLTSRKRRAEEGEIEGNGRDRLKLCWQRLWEGPLQIPLFHSAKHPIHTRAQQPPAQRLSAFPRASTRGDPGAGQRETKAPKPSRPTAAGDPGGQAAAHGSERSAQLRGALLGRRPLKPMEAGGGGRETGARPTMSRVKPLKSELAEPPPRSQGTNMPAAEAGGGGRRRQEAADAAPLSSAGRGVTAAAARAAPPSGRLRRRPRPLERPLGAPSPLVLPEWEASRPRSCHGAAAGESLRAEADHPPAAGQGGGVSAVERRSDSSCPGGKGGLVGLCCSPCRRCGAPAPGGSSAR